MQILREFRPLARITDKKSYIQSYLLINHCFIENFIMKKLSDWGKIFTLLNNQTVHKEEHIMSITILDQLEDKIKQAVETIQLLQLEVEELKGKNDDAQRANEALRQEHEQLKAEHQSFQERLRSLLGQIDNV